MSSVTSTSQGFFTKVFRRPSLSLQNSISSSYSNSSFASCVIPADCDPAAGTPQPIPDIGKYLLSQQSSTSSSSHHPFPGPNTSNQHSFKRRQSGYSSACSSAHGSFSSEPRSGVSRHNSSSPRFRLASDQRCQGSGLEHVALSQQGSNISSRSNLRTPCKDIRSAFSSQSSLQLKEFLL